MGVKFTLDGARLCNKDKTQTHAKQLPQMCSTMRSFLHTDLTSHTVCLNPPFRTRIIQQCLTHFAACKRTDPRHTSLCILLPAWHNAKWLPLTQNMRIVKEYPAGTQLFDSGQPALPYAVHAYYDGPEENPEPLTLAAIGPGAMRLQAKIAGAKGVAIPDSQASHCFLHKSFATEHQLAIDKTTQDPVHLANNATCTTEGTCTFQLQLGKHTETITAYVLPDLLPGVQLILGQTWLTKNRVMLDFAKMRCTVQPHLKKIMVTPITSPPSLPSSEPVPLISFCAARLARVHHHHVQASKESTEKGLQRCAHYHQRNTIWGDKVEHTKW